MHNAEDDTCNCRMCDVEESARETIAFTNCEGDLPSLSFDPNDAIVIYRCGPNGESFTRPKSDE